MIRIILWSSLVVLVFACASKQDNDSAVTPANQCKTCDEFETRLQASEYVAMFPECDKELDNDNDGIHCDILPSGCKTCADFSSQQEANTYIILHPLCKEVLDPDGNGIYCDSLSTGGGSLGGGDSGSSCKKCSDFNNQREAKAYVLKNPACKKRLDRDGDGIYCQSLPK